MMVLMMFMMVLMVVLLVLLVLPVLLVLRDLWMPPDAKPTDVRTLCACARSAKRQGGRGETHSRQCPTPWLTRGL